MRVQGVMGLKFAGDVSHSPLLCAACVFLLALTLLEFTILLLGQLLLRVSHPLLLAPDLLLVICHSLLDASNIPLMPLDVPLLRLPCRCTACPIGRFAIRSDPPLKISALPSFTTFVTL